MGTVKEAAVAEPSTVIASIDEISDEEIYELQEKINNMPRKLLG